MTKYQDQKSKSSRVRFFNIFQDLSEESKEKLIEVLFKINRVTRN